MDIVGSEEASYRTHGLFHNDYSAVMLFIHHKYAWDMFIFTFGGELRSSLSLPHLVDPQRTKIGLKTPDFDQ